MQRLKTYKHIFLAINLLLLLMPCHLKRDIKLALGAPISQTNEIQKPKINCNITVESLLRNSVQSYLTSRYFLGENDSKLDYSYLHISQSILLPDTFAYIHQKTPLHIRHQLFLI